MPQKFEIENSVRSHIAAWARLGGFVLLVCVMVPLFLALRAMRSEKTKDMPRRFHRMLCRIVGLKVRVHGRLKRGSSRAPVLYVSNHSSYLDIPVLGGVVPASFVAKSEVGGWPFIGTMARLQNTVFIERRAVRAGQQSAILRQRLEDGESIIVFPEGTSSDGMRTLPFKSSLFSIVEEPLPSGAPVLVQPVTILCTEIGGLAMGRSWRPYYAWFGDMTLVRHVWTVFKIGAFTVDVIFHDPVSIHDFPSRKALAEACQKTIASGVDRCVRGAFGKRG